MSTAGRIALGVGIGMLGTPPPLVGQLTGGVVALAVRLSGLVNRGMLDPRPVLIAVLVSLLPFAPACGDDSGATTDEPTCREREGNGTAYGFCGCNEQSPLAAECRGAGYVCVFDKYGFGSVCSPPCDDAGACKDYFYESTTCDYATNLCLVPCDGGSLDFNCPFGMQCTATDDDLFYCQYQGD